MLPALPPSQRPYTLTATKGRLTMYYPNYSPSSGKIYFVRANCKEKDGEDPKSGMIWLNRLAVVISSQDDINQSDYILVVPLSKAALTNPWYDSFSPARAYVQYHDEDRVALCSHVTATDKGSLNHNNYRGRVTEDELESIVNAVRRAYPPEECFLNCLYSAEDRDKEPLIG